MLVQTTLNYKDRTNYFKDLQFEFHIGIVLSYLLYLELYFMNVSNCLPFVFQLNYFYVGGDGKKHYSLDKSSTFRICTVSVGRAHFHVSTIHFFKCMLLKWYLKNELILYITSHNVWWLLMHPHKSGLRPKYLLTHIL